MSLVCSLSIIGLLLKTVLLVVAGTEPNSELPPLKRCLHLLPQIFSVCLQFTETQSESLLEPLVCDFESEVA